MRHVLSNVAIREMFGDIRFGDIPKFKAKMFDLYGVNVEYTINFTNMQNSTTFYIDFDSEALLVEFKLRFGC